MRIALVHDDFVQAGGAESLFATIASLWPNAPIYTSLVDWHKLPTSIDRTRIKTSFIQKILFATKFYKLLLPFYPLAFESFNFDDYDLVLSSTTRFAKSLVTKPQTNHICYINSLPRFLWSEAAKKHYLPFPFNFLAKPLLNWLKRYDLAASARVDHYIANSQAVADRVQKYYGRDCSIIYPFVSFDLFKVAKIHNWHLKSQDYFLIVSRLVKWKRVDVAMAAAKKLGFNLKIIGVGPDESRLKRLASGSPQIEFLTKVTKKELVELYQNAKALIVTQEEDFGLSALEAQACGIPAIAFARGGVAEIVQEGKTGLLYKEQNPKSLEDAIIKMKEVKWNVSELVKNAKRFSRSIFVKSLTQAISSYGRSRS